MSENHTAADVRGVLFEGKEPSRRSLVDWLQRKAQREQAMREQDRAGLELRPFTCTWPGCSYAATTQQNLDTHYRKHTGERPHKCTWLGCSYAAATKQQLETHYRKHTGEKHVRGKPYSRGYALPL